MQAEVARHSAEGATAGLNRLRRSYGWQATLRVVAADGTSFAETALDRRCPRRNNYSGPLISSRNAQGFLTAMSGPPVATQPGMRPKRFVYLLHSVSAQSRPYIGLTHDVRSPLANHNAGRCPHTTRYRPWQLHVTIELPDEQRAVAFERYLKFGSGRAFAKRYFG